MGLSVSSCGLVDEIFIVKRDFQCYYQSAFSRVRHSEIMVVAVKPPQTGSRVGESDTVRGAVSDVVFRRQSGAAVPHFNAQSLARRAPRADRDEAAVLLPGDAVADGVFDYRL